MAKRAFFSVWHIMQSDSVFEITMDPDLLDPAVGILDPDTHRLKIKNGSSYTFKPLEDPQAAILQRVKRAYLTMTTKPATLFSTQLGRVDELMMAVSLLFKPVEFVLIESREELEKLVNHTQGFEPRIEMVFALDEMLQKALADVELDDSTEPS